MRASFDEFARRIGLRTSLLVAIPHPDDETLGCGGLLCLATAQGIDVTTILVTDGGASHPGSKEWPRSRLVMQRKAELRRALEALGISAHPICLDLPDAATANLSAGETNAAAQAFSDVVRAVRPDVVLTTWRREPHCDHRFTFELARAAVSSANFRIALVEYMVWTPLSGETADHPSAEETSTLYLDVSAALPLKRAALQCHESQLGGLVVDDPRGFRLTGDHVASMVGQYERFEVAR